MRLIRRLVLLAIIGVGGVAAFNYWSENGGSLRPSAATLDVEAATKGVARLADRAATKASDAAERIGDRASRAGDRIADRADKVADRASRAADRMADKASHAADRMADKAGDAADTISDRVAAGALTAKIKSKMALDDRVNARAINVDTSGSIVTLTGIVASSDQRDRAVRLARDTDGVTRVVDRLQIRKP